VTRPGSDGSIDVLFVSSGDPAEDRARLARLLERPEQLARFVVVADRRASEELIEEQISDSEIPRVNVSGGPEVGLNRALLVCERDVLVSLPGFTPHRGCIAELLAISNLHDRVGAAVPVFHGDAFPPEDEPWPHENGLFAATEIPAADGGLLLMKRDPLDMMGALDPAFSSWPEALVDWCLRAQHLGYVTVRAMRALARSSRLEASRWPGSRLLDTRHPFYARQRQRAETDLTARLSVKALAAGRRPLSVCIDARYLPADAVNGTGVYAVELGRGLLEHTPARVSWLVATTAQRDALRSLLAPVYLEGQAVPEMDVVHRPAQVFNPKDLAWLLHAPAPLVITYQDLIAYRAASAHASGEAHELYQLLSRLSVRSAQAIVAISHHNRAEVVRDLQIPAEQVHVVHHGVHADRLGRRDVAENTRLLRGLRVSDRFFFAVGSDYAHKNVRLLLAAYQQFRSLWRGPGATAELAIIGHPSGTIDGVFPTLRESPPPGVRYLGGVSDAELVALYQESIALAYPSAYEGFGLPILEAMAARTPVLCSRCSSLPEVAGEAACYIDTFSDAAVARQLFELASREELRQKLIALGTQQVKKFTWAETARKTYAVYERALAAPPVESVRERRLTKLLLERMEAWALA
jgi:glycosyltransferase involved in cell wall biosynthesis